MRRELPDQRTPYSKTYDNGDGTRTLESYGEPIHYRDAASGNYEEIDTSLVATDTPHGKGLTNRANAFSLHLPDTTAAAPVVIEAGGVGISMTVRSRILEPEVIAAAETAAAVPEPASSRSRRYAGAFDGADIVYDSTPRGLKETIVVNRFTGKSIFSYDLDCTGLVPSVTPTGSVSFTHEKTGREVFRMAPPFMEDSAPESNGGPAYSDAVRYELKATGGSWRLDLVADRDWMRDPLRVYPIKIDPTTYIVDDSPVPCAEAYVYSSTPTTKYGASTEVRAGRISTTYGINYAYVRPLGDLTAGLPENTDVIDAELRLYCFDRRVTSATQIRATRVTAAWDEYAITYANRPSTASTYVSTSVTEGAWASWDVTADVQRFISGEVANHGFALYSPVSDGSADTYCRFYAWEYGATYGPRVVLTYTTRPQAKLVAPSAEVAVGTHGSQVHAHWTYADSLGKKQSAVQVQVASAPPAVTWDSQKVALDEDTRAYPITVPTAPGRYWIRMRIWGQTAEHEGPAMEAVSEWTDWQPFDRAAVTSNPSTPGLHSSAAAADPVAAGLAVDLTTGRLKGTRTDFSAPGLGGPISYGTYYDSGDTVDRGLGAGWRIAEPTITKRPQVLDNAGFEGAPTGGNNPPGWLYSTDLLTARASGLTPHGGSYYLLLGAAPSYGYYSAYVSNNAGGTQGTPVYPGERISARAWVLTYLLERNPDPSVTEYGALMKFHFYDATGAYLSSAVSGGYCAYNTATPSSAWRQIGLECDVPEGAYFVKLNLEARNVRGATYWDDVSLETHGITHTDADGTVRTFDQVGPGIYTRDPLEPGVRFTRVNALAGAQGGSGKATDGVVYGSAAYTPYDMVAWAADGTSSLDYRLKGAELLDSVDLHLWDGAENQPRENAPRTYTYAIDVSVDGVDWERVVAQTTGSSWMHHAFTPRR
ncbi:MAG: DNRLRE domain-containing protein, partial [Coriobacteriia bacterium]|nr:DNRLRE domain-containing protein [Coriobacteriia bacterium]